MGITINRGTVMGQYHLTVNLDKKEFLLPHKFGVGLKLREQFGVHYGVQDALLMLLACSNGYGGGDGCTADVSSHYLDISDMIIPVMMANDGGFILDVKENGWRSRQRMADMQDDMVSMDDILQGGLSTNG